MNSENSYWGCRCSDDYFFEIVEPENLRYSLQIRIAQFCKRPSENVLYMRLVLAMPPKLCTEAENAQFLWNNAVLIERGECSFYQKSMLAEKSGARVVLITDIEKGDDEFLVMSTDDPSTKLNIPVFYLPGVDGRHLRKHLLYSQSPIKIRIPLNYSTVQLHLVRKPPWNVSIFDNIPF
ncbi:Protease-associated domain-containing protein 1 [Trichinella sp. T8]|nr:Protease-associated domain-containing protein 1 [Trichinella sp. T8]